MDSVWGQREAQQDLASKTKQNKSISKNKGTGERPENHDILVNEAWVLLSKNVNFQLYSFFSIPFQGPKYLSS